MPRVKDSTTTQILACNTKWMVAFKNKKISKYPNERGTLSHIIIPCVSLNTQNSYQLRSTKFVYALKVINWDE